MNVVLWNTASRVKVAPSNWAAPVKVVFSNRRLGEGGAIKPGGAAEVALLNHADLAKVALSNRAGPLKVVLLNHAELGKGGAVNRAGPLKVALLNQAPSAKVSYRTGRGR